jgi:hypothetical protein
MTIKFEWNTLARVGLDPQGKLAFPCAPSRPSLYRFEFDGAKGRQEYGETDTLGRRFQHYRTLGPSQSANVQLNALMHEVINSNYAAREVGFLWSTFEAASAQCFGDERAVKWAGNRRVILCRRYSAALRRRHFPLGFQSHVPVRGRYCPLKRNMTISGHILLSSSKNLRS